MKRSIRALMKKGLPLLMTAVLLLGCFSMLGTAAYSSPVTNGGFEETDSLGYPIGWLLQANTAVSAVRVPAGGQSGAWLRLPAGSDVAVVETEEAYALAVDPSSPYTLSFYGWAEGDLIPTVVQLQADGTGSADGNLELSAGVVSDTAEWTEREITFVTSADTVAVILRFTAIGGNAGLDGVDLQGGLYADNSSVILRPENIVYGSAVNNNLLVNGDFEDGTTKWDVSAGGSIIGAGFAHGGEGYAVLDRSGGAGTVDLFTEQFPVQPNTEYTISYWKYSEAQTQTYCTIRLCNASNGIISNSNKGTGLIATEGWQQYSWTFTTTAETRYVRIDFQHNAGTGISYIDDVTVTAAGSDENIIPNGDFENGMSKWVNGSSGGATGSVAVSVGAYAGNGALKLDRTDRGGTLYGMSNQFAVQPNTEYTVTYWEKVTAIGQAYVAVQEFGTAGHLGGTNFNVKYNTVSTPWTQKSFTFTTKANATAIRIDLYINDGAGIAYFDEVTVVPTQSIGTEPDTPDLPDDITNLVPNGDFEQQFANWQKVNDGSFGNVTMSNVAHGGDYALKLTHTGTDGQTVAVNSNLVPVEPNTEYIITYWQKIESRAQSYLLIYEHNPSSYTSLGVQNVVSQVMDWTQKSFTFTTSANTDSIRIDFNCNAYRGVVYFDDVVLCKTADLPVEEKDPDDHGGDLNLPSNATNLLANGAFDVNTNGYNLNGAASLVNKTLKLTDAVSSNYVMTTVPVKAGESYVLSFYVYVSKVTAGFDFSVAMFGNGTVNGSTVEWVVPSIKEATGDWKYVTYKWTAANTGNVQIAFKNYSSTAGGTYYLDDISVYEVIKTGNLIIDQGHDATFDKAGLAGWMLSGANVSWDSAEQAMKLDHQNMAAGETTHNAYVNVSPLLTIEPNTNYQFSWKHKTSGTPISVIILTLYNGSTQVGVKQINLSRSENWVADDWILNSGNATSLRIDLQTQGGEAPENRGILWFDDLSVRATNEAAYTGLLNGDFENATDLRFWAVLGGYPRISTSVVHAGTKALMLDRGYMIDPNNSAVSEAIAQNGIAVEGGKSYQINYFQKIVGGGQIFVKIVEYNAAGNRISNTNYNITHVTGDVDWKKMAIRFQTRTDAVAIGIELYNNLGNGIAYIDDISMTEIASIVDPLVPQNGDFAYRDFNKWKEVSYQPTERNGQTLAGQDTVAGQFDFHEDEAGLSGIAGFSSQGFGRIESWGVMKYYDLNGQRTTSGDYFGMNSAITPIAQPNGAYAVELYLRTNAEARDRLVRVMITRYDDQNGNPVQITSAPNTVFDLRLDDTDDWQKIKVWFDGNGADYVTVTVLMFDGDSGETAVIDVDCVSMTTLSSEPIGGNYDMQIGELGGSPANWSKGGHSGSTLTLVESPSGVAGDMAAKLTYPTNDYEHTEMPYAVAMSQLVPVKAGRVYEISYWAKVNGYARTNGWLDVIQFKDAKQTSAVSGSPNGMYRQWAQYKDTSTWQKVSFTLRTTTKFAVEDIYLRLDFAIRGEGEFLFDNISVRELTDEETAPNFDFENDFNSDDIPDTWYMSLGRDMVGYREIDDTFWHDGKQSMHIVRQSASEHGFVDSCTLFPVTAGYVYEFSYWYASCNASPEAYMRMDMYFYDENGNKLMENGAQRYVRGRQATLNGNSERDAWSQNYTRSEVPSGAVYASLQFYYTKGDSEVWVDDICVVPVMDSPATADTTFNIITHSDFHAVTSDGEIPKWSLLSDSGTADFSVVNKPEDADYDKYDNAYSYFDENQQLQTEYYDDYGRLTVTDGQHYMKYTTTGVMTNYQYQVLGRYRSDKSATAEVRFYDYKGTLIAEKTKQIDLAPTAGEWAEYNFDFIAPSHTYVSVLLGLDEAGTLETDNLLIMQTGQPLTQGAWSGKWVWYNEDPKQEAQNQYRFFRYEFELDEEITYAPLQITADDQFTLYVNGEEVCSTINTTDEWSNVQVLFLTGENDEGEEVNYLRKGKNVFAIKVMNGVSEAGLIFDGKWTTASGASVSIVSINDDSIRATKTNDPGNIRVEPQDDAKGNKWYAPDYEMTLTDEPVAEKWSLTRSFGVPPCQPWGNIFYTSSLYSHNSIEITNLVGDNAIVTDGVYEFEMSLILKEKLTSSLPLKATIWVKNSVNQASSGSLVPVTNTDMTAWPVGQEFTVKFRMRVPSYLESGRYTLQWDDTYISISNSDITDGKFISFRLINETSSDEKTVAEMQMFNGAPTMIVNGEPVSFWAYSRPDYNQFTWDHEAAMINSGMEVYVVRQGGLGKNSLDFCWPADGVVDYDAFDDPIYETLSNNPDAYLCVQVGVFAPEWWFDAHPEDRVLCSTADGFNRYAESNSFASETFNVAAGEVVRKLMEHMKEQSYYSRVIDIQVTCATSFEGMYWSSQSLTQFADYSEPFIKGFQKWLEQKYGTVEALQKAWGDNTITTFYDYEDYDWSQWSEWVKQGYSEIERWRMVLPEWGDHIKDVRIRPLTYPEQVAYIEASGSNGTFLNMSKGVEQQIQDSNDYLMETITDAYLYWGGIVDEVLEGEKLMSCYNGYLFAGAGAQDIPSQHTAFTRLLESGLYDMFVSPASYAERDLGTSDTFMGAQDTIQSYGKMAIIEEDHRSSLNRPFGAAWDAGDDLGVGATRTMEEFLQQVKKNTANAMVNGNGVWMFDMQGGWYDDDQFYQLSQEIKEEWDISQFLDKDLTSEVAYYIDEDMTTYFVRDFTGKTAQQMVYSGFRMQRKELQRLGDSFDVYLTSTLAADKVPDHKINIIFGAYELTAEERAGIERNLMKDGKIVVWAYANGLTDGNVNDIELMSSLIGIPLVLDDRYGNDTVIITDESADKNALGYMTSGITGMVYGAQESIEPYNQSPIIYGDASRMDSTYTVLGHMRDNGAPGLIAKDMGNWTSVYSAATSIPAEMIRNLMAMTDVHTYTDDLSMNVFSNGAYVTAHSASEGTKTLKLDGRYAVYDVYAGEFVSMDTDTITYENTENGTKLYRLTTPNTYLAVSRIRGGHGTISTVGATEVPVGEGYSLTVKPDDGYEIDSITVNGETVKATDKLDWDTLEGNLSILVKFKKIATPSDEPTPPAEDDTPSAPDNTPSGPSDDTPEPPSDEPSAPGTDEPEFLEPTIIEIINKVTRLNWTAVFGIINTVGTVGVGIGMLIWFILFFKKKKEQEEAQKGE